MTSKNLRLSDKIEGWDNQEEDNCPSSNNMLRILQNKIINSVRMQERLNFNENAFNRAHNVRPATVRVRPSTSKNQTPYLQSHPTIDLCTLLMQDLARDKSRHDEGLEMAIKQRNKSVGNNIKSRGKNKENLNEKQFYSLVDKQKQRAKGEEFQMKKQSLIFKNGNALRSKRVINNFHEMEIKMRKNRLQTNKGALLSKEKVQIIVESHRQGTEIKIGKCHMQMAADQNLFQLGLQKTNQNHYTKLSRKFKFLPKDKEARKKQMDDFADNHLAEPVKMV